MGFIIIAILFAATYLFLQLFYLLHWLKTKSIVVPDSFIPSTTFSVVVIANNEENTIEECIQRILHQHYPIELFEVIVIDDRSTDGTVEKIKALPSPNLQFYHLHDFPELIHAPAFKKSAIELAVSRAKYDWIITTDADCNVYPDWLLTIAYAQSVTGSVFLAAPIRYASYNSLLEKMQGIEMMTFMMITAAGIRSRLHDMANGANMAFSKQAFIDVDGYNGNYNYASGDDMFLIEKMRAKFPDKISFVKSQSAVVETEAHQDWSSLLKQRVRWAGKNKGLKNPVINMIWLFIGFYHVMIFAMFGLALLHYISWLPFTILLSFKWIADAVMIYHASSFFKRSWLRDFVPLQVLYSVYILRLGWNLMLGKKGDWT